MHQRMPFPLLGLDTDNDSVFMNETGQNLLRGSRVGVHAMSSVRKNDQAWVEQKNGAVVRHAVGYRRYGGWRRPLHWRGCIRRCGYS